MRPLHLGVVQDRPWSVLVAFVSKTCNIGDDQLGTKIEFKQNKKYHIRQRTLSQAEKAQKYLSPMFGRSLTVSYRSSN